MHSLNQSRYCIIKHINPFFFASCINNLKRFYLFLFYFFNQQLSCLLPLIIFLFKSIEHFNGTYFDLHSWGTQGSSWENSDNGIWQLRMQHSHDNLFILSIIVNILYEKKDERVNKFHYCIDKVHPFFLFPQNYLSLLRRIRKQKGGAVGS